MPKGPFDKKSVDQNAVDETSFRPTVLSTKRPSTKLLSTKPPSTKRPIVPIQGVGRQRMANCCSLFQRYLARSGKPDGSTLSAASIVKSNTDLILSLARMAAHGYNTNSRKIVFDDNDLIRGKVDVEKGLHGNVYIIVIIAI